MLGVIYQLMKEAQAVGDIMSAADGGLSDAERQLARTVLDRAQRLAAAADLEAIGRGGPTAAVQEGSPLQALLPQARELAAALLAWWRRPERQPEAALERAHAATARSCANLRCANLAGEGGPAAGEGAGSSKCSGCRVAW